MRIPVVGHRMEGLGPLSFPFLLPSTRPNERYMPYTRKIMREEGFYLDPSIRTWVQHPLHKECFYVGVLVDQWVCEHGNVRPFNSKDDQAPPTPWLDKCGCAGWRCLDVNAPF